MNIINRMAVEVTLRCNLSCPQCDHHCDLGQLPYVADSDITMDQVRKFTAELRDTGTRVIRLSVGGGEPLVHPEFPAIIRELHANAVCTGNVARRRVRVISNGTVPHPPGLTGMCYIKTLVRVSDRGGIHLATWTAPSDTGQAVRRPKLWVRAGCNVPFRCGMVLNKWGYWPCGPGGAICRLFGLNRWVRYKLPIDPWSDWDLQEFNNEVCSLCQYAAREPIAQRDAPSPSPRFQEVLSMTKRSVQLY